jgi:hypothetical protein
MFRLITFLRLFISGQHRWSRCWLGLHHWDHPGGHCKRCGKCDELFGQHGKCRERGNTLTKVYTVVGYVEGMDSETQFSETVAAVDAEHAAELIAHRYRSSTDLVLVGAYRGSEELQPVYANGSTVGAMLLRMETSEDEKRHSAEEECNDAGDEAAEDNEDDAEELVIKDDEHRARVEDAVMQHIRDLQAYKLAHDDARSGIYCGSIGSMLNAYREGDMTFTQVVDAIMASAATGNLRR